MVVAVLGLGLVGVVDGVADVADRIVGAVLGMGDAGDGDGGDGHGGEDGLGKAVSHDALQ